MIIIITYRKAWNVVEMEVKILSLRWHWENKKNYRRDNKKSGGRDR